MRYASCFGLVRYVFIEENGNEGEEGLASLEFGVHQDELLRLWEGRNSQV
jgi:hypothetical protein